MELLTDAEKINYSFLKLQILPYKKLNGINFQIFETITKESFAVFGENGFSIPFEKNMIYTYYNLMLEKSLERQKTLNNKKKLTQNFSQYCIDWLLDIEKEFDKFNQKELPSFITDFLDFCNEIKTKDDANLDLVIPQQLETTTKNVSDLIQKTNKDKTQTYWFKVGLLFATGEIDNLVKVHESATAIANFKGNKNYRPYISDTLGSYAKGDKNIYHNPKKVKDIFDYCIENNIKMTQKFIDKQTANEPI